MAKRKECVKCGKRKRPSSFTVLKHICDACGGTHKTNKAEAERLRAIKQQEEADQQSSETLIEWVNNK